MDRLILWTLFIIGIALLGVSLFRKPALMKDSLLVFALKAYFSTFFGVFVVEAHMLDYPVRFLPSYFDTSILFEYFLFPIVCVYFYQTTYYSSFGVILWQCALYTAAITIVEVLCEKYTDLIEYHTWTWWYSFLTIFFLSFFVRMIMLVVNKKFSSGTSS
ncbi:CBO0543 family protein [Anoxybacteroides amylolyticum]|uniref:Putative membrane protein n=1 Tax=Anoxybacteroides amylolyticum TaxID=294699 RepID=A0A160F3S7_9BACL|nr:CBO0543 family protein [Anoxybacillus amylolyticus]ANB61017.1 putative membrane protein [Anoxybacillus amylolyticus]